MSGHFWKGPPYRCLVAAEAGLVALVLSDSIVAELREKLTEKFNVTPEDVDAVVDHLNTYAASQEIATCSTWARLRESMSSPRANSSTAYLP